MAQLPPDGLWLVQAIDTDVIVVHRDTQEEIVRFDVTSPDATAKALKVIYDSRLTDEQKSFAYFWCGYFHAHLVRRRMDDFAIGRKHYTDPVDLTDAFDG
jgi:hypothetical protein